MDDGGDLSWSAPTVASAPYQANRFRLQNRSGPQARRRLLDEARKQLLMRPPEISPKWFYDARGSELFEAITQLPEYYPTRREREILERRASEIASLTRPQTMIELGSGSSEKTRILLDALVPGGALWRFVPFDVSESAIRKAGIALVARYPKLFVDAYIADFEHDLRQIPAGERRLIIFLGGTIGNLRPPLRKQFLAELARELNPGDWLLLGTDLVKNPERLHAAYNDSAGVTAEFNRNILNALNREVAANFDGEQFEHRAFYDPTKRWIEMRLRATGSQDVQIPLLKVTLHFERGDEILTEISAKFRETDIEKELTDGGFHLQELWTDDAGDFAISLSRKS